MPVEAGHARSPAAVSISPWTIGPYAGPMTADDDLFEPLDRAYEEIADAILEMRDRTAAFKRAGALGDKLRALAGRRTVELRGQIVLLLKAERAVELPDLVEPLGVSRPLVYRLAAAAKAAEARRQQAARTAKRGGDRQRDAADPRPPRRR